MQQPELFSITEAQLAGIEARLARAEIALARFEQADTHGTFAMLRRTA